MASIFKVPYGQYQLDVDIVGGDEGEPVSPDMVVLHGAGQSHKGRLLPLRQKLAEQQLSSLAVDFVGHGLTGGQVAESSLESRTRQAYAALEYCQGQHKPIAVLGTSMGAYNAIRLLERLEVSTLVLMVPGIYTPKAYSTPFTSHFSDIIRVHDSWKSSDAYQILSSFNGRLLVVAAEHDEVIPADIPKGLFECAQQAQEKVFLEIKGAKHQVINHLANHKEQLDEIIDKIAKLTRKAK